jgi:glycosyltransferase A (GT-A) superfamily protein (DUF2064 family)
MGEKVINVFATIVVLAIVTTVLLPGRQTPGVIKAIGDAFSGGIRAASNR